MTKEPFDLAVELADRKVSFFYIQNVLCKYMKMKLSELEVCKCLAVSTPSAEVIETTGKRNCIT